MKVENTCRANARSSPKSPAASLRSFRRRRGRTQAYGAGPEWFAARGGSTGGRVFVARLGPWRLFGIVLLFGLVTGAVLAFVLGALLIAIPVVGLLVLGAVLANALRRR